MIEPISAGDEVSGLTRMRSGLLVLWERAQDLDIRALEAEPTPAALTAFRARVVALVENTLGLCDEVQALGEALGSEGVSAGTEGSNFLFAVDTVLANEAGAQRVADLAFIAALELRQRKARLEQGVQSDAWEQVCDCGSALRRVAKSLAALELGLADLTGEAPRIHHDTELGISLLTRRLYRKLWTFAQAQGEPEDVAQVRSALRGAGTLIAMLVGRDEYCRLREQDRRQFRELQARILAWLAQAPGDARAGARVWADFAAFATMLRQVSHREELVRHDRELLTQAWGALSRDREVSAHGALAVLKPLEGLDPGLDVLHAATTPAVDTLREVLRPLCARLGVDTGEAAGFAGEAW